MKNQRKNGKPQYKKKDLISLVWPVNTCYSELISGVPQEVTVDLAAGTWTFKGQTQPIGSRRNPCMDYTGHPIGVFDRTKIKHLQAFQDTVEWVRDKNRPLSDD